MADEGPAWPADDIRVHGAAPYRVALVHGGPGAAGEMASLARALAARRGVLEPLQTRTTVSGQVREMASQLQEHGDPPVTLVGFSWGAWLALLTAAEHPRVVDRIVLVGCPPLEEGYVAAIRRARLARLDEAERAEYEALLRDTPGSADNAATARLARLGALAAKADSYDALPDGDEGPPLDVRGDIFESVWPEATRLRRSGELLAAAARLRCPVLAVHGSHDPHPAAGVREPLSARLGDFRFELLPKCGHKPWVERWARDAFLQILEAELSGRQS